MHKSKGYPTVVLSFDDGYEDNWCVARPIIADYNLKATYNIITGKTGTDGFMSRTELEKLYSEGHEIAAHSRLHSNSKEDILQGVTDLLDWEMGCAEHGVGFASPNSGLGQSKCREMEMWFANNHISYVRTGIAEGFMTPAKRIKRKFLNLFRCDGAFLLDLKNNNSLPLTSSYGLLSQVVVKNTKVEQIKEIITKGWDSLIILMLHSILQDLDCFQQKYLYSWPVSEFEKLCHWLAGEQANGKLEVLTTMHAVKRFNAKNNI